MDMLKTPAIPAHVGFILDGNRRWAKEKGLPALEGHRRGSDKLRDIAVAAFDRGVQVMSAFVFSTENWNRTEKEVNYLMGLVSKMLDKYLEEFHERGIKVVVLGRREGLRSKVLDSLKRSEEQTANNTNGTLALCFNYGGREEIADAAQKLIASGTQAADITPATFEQALYQSDIPNIDLLIRTSGEQRLSGFMLWRAAYAELLFTDTYWPDYSEAELDEALAEYARRERRYGK
jgi:undecaprenyl diphosphate synthase